MTEPFPGGPIPGTLKGGSDCGGGGGGPGGMCIEHCPLAALYPHHWRRDEDAGRVATGLRAPMSLIS